ncbi:MAG: hypothetical protein ACM3O4_02865 [Ignavibacteriales bacterium]
MKIKKYIILTLILGFGTFMYFYGETLAKYVSNLAWDYYLKSKGFYFSSSYLATNPIQTIDSKWNGESVHFSVKNNLNQSVITSYDISYEVACTIKGDAALHSECHMNGTELNTFNGTLTPTELCVNNTGDQVDVSAFDKSTCETGNYDWVSQITTNDLYFDIILTDVQYELKDVTVEVKATSKTPYRKILIGDFILHKVDRKEDTLSLDYKNYTNYDRLIISNLYATNKCAKVTWDDTKLIIDSNLGIDNDQDGYADEIKFNIEAKKSLSYIFYKKNFEDIYTTQDFTIEETSGC